jgi:hypothetical protein
MATKAEDASEDVAEVVDEAVEVIAVDSRRYAYIHI